MHKSEKFIQQIVAQGLLPLYFHADETRSVEILEALYEAGIRVVEYTNRGGEAMKNLKHLKKLSSQKFPGMQIGMGTITDKKSARKAMDAGADFLVSPGFSVEISDYVQEEEIFWIPGCMTPSDLMAAKNAGIQFVKIFPGSLLGVGFLKAVKEVFPELLFMPTGGVDSGNLESWFNAGVSAVGMGGSLISKSIIEQRDYEQLILQTKSVIDQIASIRSTK